MAIYRLPDLGHTSHTAPTPAEAAIISTVHFLAEDQSLLHLQRHFSQEDLRQFLGSPEVSLTVRHGG
jgi:hypothetical protein